MGAAETRRRTILSLISEREVSSQGELLDLLAERGLSTTQPQLSRDLRALHVAKQDGAYVVTERVTSLQTLASLLRKATTVGEHLVVVHCEPGAASAIARALEAEELEGVVGSVAGDDTVFVAVERAGDAQRLAELVGALLD